MPDYLGLLLHTTGMIQGRSSQFVQLRLLLSRRVLSAQLLIWLTSRASAAFVCSLECGCRHRQLNCCAISFSFGRSRSSGIWGDKESHQVLYTSSTCFTFWNFFTFCGVGKKQKLVGNLWYLHPWNFWNFCLFSYPHFHSQKGSRSLWFFANVSVSNS